MSNVYERRMSPLLPVAVAICGLSLGTTLAAPAASMKGASVGQEQQDVTRRLRETAPRKERSTTKLPKLNVADLPPPPAPAGEPPAGSKWLYEVRFTVPTNCTSFLESLQETLRQLAKSSAADKAKGGTAAPDTASLSSLLAAGRCGITGNTLYVRDSFAQGRSVEIKTVREGITNLLARTVNSGYYLATLQEEPADITNGVVGVRLDPGRVGALNVTFAGKSGEGHYFSNRQIARKFAALTAGEPFDYNLLYDGVYNLNSHPDLVVNADLKVRLVTENNERWRYVDVGLDVKESLPFHAIVDLSNYGTEASDNWQTGLTLQYLNLTKNDDVLTANAQSALDGSLYSLAGSYYLPYNYMKGGGVTLYGGYSKLDVEDVVPAINVEGSGWFVGLQYSANIIETRHHHLALSLGKVHRYIEDQLIVDDMATEARGVDVGPFSLALIYNTKPSQSWSGRLYGTVELLYNKGDFLGTSNEEEIQRLRREASEDYFLVRPQLALIQPFGGRAARGGARDGQWLFFTRVAGQWADGPLIPGEQLGIGGHNTVRGYREREFLGDYGYYANFEIRTPMLLGFLSRPFASEGYRKRKAGNPLDRLQFVAFLDVGQIKIKDALPGEDSSQSLYSVGAGLRLSVTEYAQLKFDWGFPLKETVESSHSGYGHLNLQVQF